ncbi:hypothetical protein FOQG_07728 [Fusarium oxysporum f. sp. raphani 54005]|uniref:Uncharacterized protein n=1 Tax=Fusarium oxysporum f. sp. raphani 54005 TaxID=1089458 RepID=X0CEJ4_FUSOX|nr:hypothetical protein FOQG_07728 [Fusarium oxysporum f. sp. raphani 54005]EXK89643.1 hypothetical protein FOQG_07728 [Fusarium oxysporum f. sp. raphani 54005]
MSLQDHPPKHTSQTSTPKRRQSAIPYRIYQQESKSSGYHRGHSLVSRGLTHKARGSCCRKLKGRHREVREPFRDLQAVGCASDRLLQSSAQTLLQRRAISRTERPTQL